MERKSADAYVNLIAARFGAGSDAELPAASFTDAMRGPCRLPHEVNFNFADVGDASEAVVDLLEDESGGRALRGGEGHGDADPLARPLGRGVRIRTRFDLVDQAEID